MLLRLDSGLHTIIIFLAQLALSTSTSTSASAESTDTEDLTRFSQGPEACPDFIPWPQVPAPIFCDDPACRGMPWAIPPYRCRQSDVIMFGKSTLGCPCCPRIIPCEDPSCEGDSQREICGSELLAGCICVASRRMILAPPTTAPEGDVSVEQVEEEVIELSISEATESNTQAATSNPQTCPSNPPIKCIDPQCRDLDDWRTQPRTTPRCSQMNGKLMIEGIETPLHGCQCCPEYVFCPISDCNGNASQRCTTSHLKGCFCDWPGRGPHITPWQRTPFVLFNDIDRYFDDPDAEYYEDGYGMVYPVDPDAPRAPLYDPPGGELGYTVAISTTASASTNTSAMAFETTVPTVYQNSSEAEVHATRQMHFPRRIPSV